MGNSKMTIVFLSFKVFRTVQHFAQFAKNGNLHNKWHSKYQLFCKLMKTKFKVLMKNYLLANYRLHPFISLGSRKLANIQRSMQIRMPFVQKKKKFFHIFLVKLLHHILLSAQFHIFDTIWPRLFYCNIESSEK